MTTKMSDKAARVVILVILALGIVTIVLLFNQSSAVHALNKSSARSECRTQVVNDAEDTFRHNVAELIDAANDDNRAQVIAIAKRMKDEKPTQDVIDAKCPAPLVAPPNK